LALWWFLPLRVPLTPFRLLWFVGLIVTWYLAEGAGAVRQWESGATTADGHEVAVGGAGIYLLLSAVLHHPVDSLVVPLVLLLWWLRAGRVRTAPATMPATETDRP